MHQRAYIVLPLTIAGGLLIGCGSGMREAEMKRLADAVEKLERRSARQESRIEELSNQVFVLSDRVDSARVEMERKPAPPPLAVVKLVPDTPPNVAPPTRSEPDSGQADVMIMRNADGVATVMPVARKQAAATRAAKAKAAPDAERSFRDALTAYRQGRVEAAYKRFARFLREHGTHPYADNARYWMGECRYDAKEYREAIQQFALVLKKYPRSNKVPDALLKLGLSYERLGKVREATQAFEDLVKGYPRSAMADLARAHLSQLASAGGSK